LLSDDSDDESLTISENPDKNDFIKKYETQLNALEKLSENLNTPVEMNYDGSHKIEEQQKGNDEQRIQSDEIAVIKVLKPDKIGQLVVRIFQSDCADKLITSLEQKYGKRVQLELNGSKISPDTLIKDLKMEKRDVIDAFYF